MRNVTRAGFTISELIYVVFWLGGIIGWIANIVQVAHMISSPVTGLFIFKCVSILLFPIGAVIGWVGMF